MLLGPSPLLSSLSSLLSFLFFVTLTKENSFFFAFALSDRERDLRLRLRLRPPAVPVRPRPRHLLRRRRQRLSPLLGRPLLRAFWAARRDEGRR